MDFTIFAENYTHIEHVNLSTMMRGPALRYKKEFLCLPFHQSDAMIFKLPKDRVDELVNTGVGHPFNFTKKTFKEWVLIPFEQEDMFEDFLMEAIEFAKLKG